ncbi:hypothetical protein [Clostridium sp. HCS.1]|uniref:hypothetical protein n=1 Tax=Clostridium sp. HCS.1 TaxID=3238594 RepID=UPI003A1025DD
MLQLKPIEFLLRALPEGFLVILAIYIFSKTKINNKKYVITSLIFSLITYTVRMLPINYGVHIVLSILFLLLIVVSYNKIEVLVAIKSIIFIYLIQFVSEAINVLILTFMNIDLNIQFENPIYKSVMGIPSLIITGIIILIFYIINNTIRKNKKV